MGLQVRIVGLEDNDFDPTVAEVLDLAIGLEVLVAGTEAV